MSGELESRSPPGRDASTINTKLRACEACKTRKIRCDRLNPCSACKSANIPCWPSASRQPQEKRQRVLLSSRYEDQLENINRQLSQLQGMLASLGKDDLGAKPEQSNLHAAHLTAPSTVVNTPNSNIDRETSSTTVHYLGESSFEVHSQQTSQILEQALSNSPSSNLHHDTSSALKSLRDLLEAKPTFSNTVVTPFSHDLPMVPVQTALRILQVLDMSRNEILHFTPLADEARLKEICQLVYFPIKPYSMWDFIVVNGGLMSILTYASEEELRACSIRQDDGAKMIALCESNISAMIERLHPFVEPTITNIEGLLFAVQISLAQSKLQQAWSLISMAARLCLDSGLNRLETPESPNAPDIRAKKVCFWFAHTLDKALSLNFGRTSNFSDFDITVSYPSFPQDAVYDIYRVWLDLGRIQSRIYESLYSARGQLQDSASKARTARILASELLELQRDCQDAFARVEDQRNIPFLDTEITILSNLTLVYRSLPTQQPDHPLRFPDECISTARETLLLHQKLVSIFLGRSDNSMRMYIDWNLSFLPFTPFIVILGTAILNTNHEDMTLLSNVVDSLETASRGAPGATKLYNICKILLKGGKSCIEQNVNNPPATPSQPQTQERNMGDYAQDSAAQGNGVPQSAEPVYGGDNWYPLPLDHMNNMSSFFDNYLMGTTSMMPILEADLTQFEMMDSSGNGFS